MKPLTIFFLFLNTKQQFLRQAEKGYQKVMTFNETFNDEANSVKGLAGTNKSMKKALGSISQRVRTSPTSNLGLGLGDIQVAWIVLS